MHGFFGAVGRADLIRVLATGAVDEFAAARLCGYDVQDEAAVSSQQPPEETTEKEGQANWQQEDWVDVTSEHLAPLRALHIAVVESRRAAEVAMSDPDSADARGDMLDRLPEANRWGLAPAHRPLFTPDRVALTLRSTIRPPAVSRLVDIDRWIENAAKALPFPRRPPMRVLPSWSGDAAILVHWHRNIAPLSEDLHGLVQQAMELSGGRAQVYWVDEMKSIWRANWVGPSRQLRWICSGAQRIRAQFLLCIGALPKMSPKDGPIYWASQAHRDMRSPKRRQLAWLVPSCRQFPSAVPRARVINWEVGAGTRLRSTMQEVVTESSVDTLKAAMSLGVRIEPGLLRELRLLLGLSVDDELEVWSSAEVQTHGSVGCHVHSEYLPKYRQLARRQGENWILQVTSKIIAYHANLSPLILLEERSLAADALGGGPIAQEVSREWGKIVRTLRSAEETELIRSLSRYVSRLGKRANPSLWNSVGNLPEAWVLAERDLVESGASLPQGLPEAAVRRALAGRSSVQARRALSLVQREGDVWLVPANSQYPGVPISNLSVGPDVSGVLVEDQEGRKWKQLQVAETRLISVPIVGIARVHWGEQSIEVSNAARPDWASEWGRDRVGLYAVSTRLSKDRARFTWPPAWSESWGEDDFGIWADLRVGQAWQRMRWIPPGDLCLTVPSTSSREFRTGFWLGNTPCTQQFWLAVVKGDNPSHFRVAEGWEKRPIERVNWFDVKHFLARLGEWMQGRLDPALPNAAEWHYACNAGGETRYWWGEDFVSDAANAGEDSDQTSCVDRFKPNPFGLYDMHGNVWEWSDDVVSGDDGASRVATVLGGGWGDPVAWAGANYKHSRNATARASNQGFRLLVRPVGR